MLENDEDEKEHNDIPNHDTAEHNLYDDNSSLILKPTQCSKDPDYFKSESFKQYVANKASNIAELLSKGSKPIRFEIEE